VRSSVLDAMLVVARLAWPITLVVLVRSEYGRWCPGRVYRAVGHCFSAGLGSARGGDAGGERNDHEKANEKWAQLSLLDPFIFPKANNLLVASRVPLVLIMTFIEVVSRRITPQAAPGRCWRRPPPFFFFA
jgi:hypothetical protein